MADTGFKTAGTVETTGDWATFTVANLASSDGDYATYASGEIIVPFTAGTISDFTFGVPSGATIDGIEATAEFSSDTSTGDTTEIRISFSWNNGSNYSSTETQSVTGLTDTVKTFGGSEDTWDRSWSSSEFDDGTFLMKVEGRNTTRNRSIELNHVQVKVYYTEVTADVLKINIAGYNGVRVM